MSSSSITNGEPGWVSVPRKSSFDTVPKKVSVERLDKSRKISTDRVETSRKVSAGWDVLRKRSISDILRVLKGKYLCVVTGAGNGLGRAVANLVFQEGGIYPFALAGSRLILIDKDMDSLRETSGKKMKQFLKHRKIEVDLICADLGDLNETKQTITQLISTQDKDFEQATLINNITTFGDTSKKLADNLNFTELQEYFNLNITSKIFLTTEFSNGFPKAKKTIVNTLNYDASRPNAYLGLPYMASSAIKAFSEVYAKENPKIKVLVFTPNRVNSGSTKEILENCSNIELKEEIQDAIKQNKLCAPLETAKKLSRILEENNRMKYGIILEYNEEDFCNNNM